MFTLIALWPLLNGEGVRWWAALVAGVFLTAAIFAPYLLVHLNRLWSKLGLVLHRITNPLVLGIIFFVALTPMALAMRIFRKDHLNLKYDTTAKSYWILRDPPGPDSDSMKHQF